MVTSNIQYPQALKIFLCHSSNDKPTVRSLYRRLRRDGMEPWLDEENLDAGQEWEREILKAVRSSHIVLVCLSRNSINKAGYVQKEIKFALDVADEQPENTIFIVPLKLEECDVPERLQCWHWINLFDETGYERLMRALRKRADSLGIQIEKAVSSIYNATYIREIIQDLIDENGNDKILVTGTRRQELEALKHYNSILTELLQFNVEIGSLFDREVVFSKAVELIFRMTVADRVIALVNDKYTENNKDGDVTKLRIAAIRARNNILEAEATQMTAKLFVAAKVIEECVTYLSSDVSLDQGFSKFYLATPSSIRVYSMICAPMIRDSVVYGALYADRVQPDIPLDHRDIEVIDALSLYTSIAIEKINLHERLLHKL
jgi:nucleotide-binding universal stress UspA family protein